LRSGSNAEKSPLRCSAAGTVRLNEELAAYRRIAPEKLRPWEFGTGLAVADWLARRRA